MMYRRPYLMSLPAILVIALYGTVLARSIWIQDSLQSRYRGLAEKAIESSEFELAQTYYERVIQLGEKRESDDDLNLVLAKMKTGNIAAAQELLDRLAPDDGVGYPKAHRMKALQLVAALTGASRDDNPELSDTSDHATINQSAWELVRVHLSRSGLDQPVELADLWTSYYLAAGKTSEAIECQMDVSQIQPDRWLSTAQLCVSLNDEAHRKRATQQAELYFESKVKDNPFATATRVNLARVYVLDNRLDEAAFVIFEGLKFVGNDSSPAALDLRRAASEVLLLQMDSVPGKSEQDLAAKHLLVARAIELEPNNPLAYKKLLEMIESEGSGENRGKLIRILEVQIAEGKSIAVAHFAIGLASWTEGNRETAIWHTGRALELEPRMVEVMNNFAWMLAHNDDPDLPRALELVDSALAKRPSDLRFRDTRGTILMKMQRWEDALTEFESILPMTVPRDRQAIHQSLADIYSALGISGLAELHRTEQARLAGSDSPSP